MNAALRLGLRHALNAVSARLELEAREHALAEDAQDHFLVAAELRMAFGDDLDLPAATLGIARVHAEEVAREKPRLVAAGAGANFKERVALVVWILGQQRLLQVGLQPLH